jgi:hypothetical protein
LKVRYNDMDETMRSTSLNEPSDIEQDIYPLLPGMLKRAWERRVSLRLVSLRLTGIYGGIFRTELPLDAESVKRINERKLATVLDQLRAQHSIMRGHDLWLKRQDGRPRPEKVCARNTRAATVVPKSSAGIRSAQRAQPLLLSRFDSFHSRDHRAR